MTFFQTKVFMQIIYVLQGNIVVKIKNSILSGSAQFVILLPSIVWNSVKKIGAYKTSSTWIDIFETAYIFYTDRRSVHTKSVNPLTKTVSFETALQAGLFLIGRIHADTQTDYFWMH